MHRLYYSKTKLSKIYDFVSPICDRCKTKERFLSHMFWFCPKLFNFWAAIFDFFSKVFQKKLTQTMVLQFRDTENFSNPPAKIIMLQNVPAHLHRVFSISILVFPTIWCACSSGRYILFTWSYHVIEFININSFFLFSK